jgi:hypothetical protein
LFWGCCVPFFFPSSFPFPLLPFSRFPSPGHLLRSFFATQCPSPLSLPGSPIRQPRLGRVASCFMYIILLSERHTICRSYVAAARARAGAVTAGKRACKGTKHYLTYHHQSPSPHARSALYKRLPPCPLRHVSAVE